MIEEHTIIDAVDFQLELSKILFTRPWKCKFKEVRFTKSKDSKAERNGIIRISYDKCHDYKTLIHEINCLLVDLHTNLAKRNSFLWQHPAKELGLIAEVTADDYAECELCGCLTPLTRSKRCVPCRRMEEDIKQWPDVARKILDRITPLEFTEEEEYEYK